ncbi:multifunctional expression regulator [Saimiriine betaherpesvirus 4]|uniref:mRNA export factor ICP27 homolog n=1 Tax=Saimiriine betaherpesvirus 4 TaxID=1535247 RepID=G8XSX3_9BETA|nr:multifunctional expression regulator [Saimiriine betaherpesvirus 4]AEV80919.1 multifunctional expression regulator [Saimiriine betaherpesvirus 4]
MDYPRSRYATSLSTLDEYERKARRARRFALDYELDNKRPRREPAPRRYDVDPDVIYNRCRPRSRRSPCHSRPAVDTYYHRRRRTYTSATTPHASGTPATTRENPFSQVLDAELSAMSEQELDHLSELIQQKRIQRQKKDAEELTAPSSTSPPYDLQRYTAESLGLIPYRDDVRKPVAFPDYNDSGRILLSHDELMQTDYIFDIRRQFDWLKPTTLQKLVIERKFSVNNASSLHTLVAMIDETLSYLKFHYVHEIPVNPYDPYVSTVHSMRQLLFNKLNNVDLACIMKEKEWGPNCSLLKQLARKPVRANHSVDNTYDVQRRPVTDFTHPLHQAMSFVTSFARSVALLKRRAEHSNTPMFLSRFDDNHAIEAYRCGMIADLTIGAFRRHECDNELCATKLHIALQSYRVMLSFCPFDEHCVLDLSPLIPEHGEEGCNDTPTAPDAPATFSDTEAPANTTANTWNPSPEPVHEAAPERTWNVSSTEIPMQTTTSETTVPDLSTTDPMTMQSLTPDYDNMLCYSDMEDDY